MNPLISAEEMQSRRKIHEASRHSLALEGLDEFVSAETEVLSEAWIRGEITLEDAIAQTLQRIRADYSCPHTLSLTNQPHD